MSLDHPVEPIFFEDAPQCDEPGWSQRGQVLPDVSVFIEVYGSLPIIAEPQLSLLAAAALTARRQQRLEGKAASATGRGCPILG